MGETAMDTRHPEAPKPRATFVLPSQGALRALDRAHEQGFRRYLRAIGHNQRSSDHRCRASVTLVELINGVTREELPPDYDDPYVAAAYVVKYHLSHCMMAYWSFGLLLDRVGVPNALYVCDVGAGTGAARVGLALALSQRKEHPATIYFNAIEPSGWMRDAGNAFWEAWRPAADLIYWEDDAPPERLPIPDVDDTLRVVTAFHLSLPYDNQPWGNVGKDAKSNIQSVLDLVSPHVGVFTAHSGKEYSLKKAAGYSSRWVDSLPARFDIPRDCGAVRDRSRFYTACAEDLGFTVPEDSSSPVRTWSRYRFSPPSGVLLLQDKRAEQEARERQRRAVVERQRQERERRERAEAAERERERREQAEQEERKRQAAMRAAAVQAEEERRAEAERQAARRAETEDRDRDPNDAAAYNDRGVAYARKGKYDRAIQDFDQALRLDPNQALAYYNRGLAYRRKGEYKRARSDFSKALALDYDRATIEALLAEPPESPQRAEEKRQRQERERRESIGVNEAAQRLGLSAAYVSRLLHEGQLAGTKGPGKLGRWRVDAADVDRLAKQRRAESERREQAEREERERQQRAAAPRSPAGPAGMPGHRVKAERQAAARAELQRRERAARAEAEHQERAERAETKRKRLGILGRLWSALKRN